MNELNPDDIRTNAEVTLRLPRVITALDYHDFTEIQRVIQEDLGLTSVYVTEVGFAAPKYVGLIHMDTESHNQLVLELERYYEQAEQGVDLR